MTRFHLARVRNGLRDFYSSGETHATGDVEVMMWDQPRGDGFASIAEALQWWRRMDFAARVVRVTAQVHWDAVLAAIDQGRLEVHRNDGTRVSPERLHVVIEYATPDPAPADGAS